MGTSLILRHCNKKDYCLPSTHGLYRARCFGGRQQDRSFVGIVMANAASSDTKVKIPEGYTPSEDETFMNPVQKEYFRQKLLEWKADIIAQTKETVAYLQGENVSHPDPADTAAANADRQLELRTKDRLRKLTNKVDKALMRIENGTYGYCEETGDPIRVKRLDARPIATLSLEAQEMHERDERTKA